MENLPPEINAKILIGLPIKTLGQLKCVSKSFNTFLKSPHFIKCHSHQILDQNSLKVLIIAASSSLHTLSIADHKLLSSPAALSIPSNDVNNLHFPTSLVGTCMGLVCLCCFADTYSLLNPTTKEFRVLPDAGRVWLSRWPSSEVSGFGYVPSLDDFMVVRVAIYRDQLYEPVIKMYSARADSWKTLLVINRVPLIRFICDYSVYVSGAVYWLGWAANMYGTRPRVCIIAFDFAKEEFSTMPLHDEHLNEAKIKGFAVLEGCLSVVVQEDEASVGIWVMKELGVKESWTKTFSFRRAFIKRNGSVIPIGQAGNEVLFEINLELCLYDPVKNINAKLGGGLRKIWSREGRLHIVRYEESLISPYDYIRKDRMVSNIVKADEEIAGLKEEINEMILKLRDAEAQEKGLLEKLRIAEEARADEKNAMEKRIRELEDELSRLRFENEEASGSGNKVHILKTRLNEEKDAAAKEVAEFKEKLAGGQDLESVHIGEGAGIDVSGSDLGPKNGEQVAGGEVA